MREIIWVCISETIFIFFIIQNVSRYKLDINVDKEKKGLSRRREITIVYFTSIIILKKFLPKKYSFRIYNWRTIQFIMN